MKLIKIGRADGCNLRLTSPNVSSIHAELLIMDDGSIILEDKHSTNGTFVGNRRIEPGTEVQVRRGDLVRFGDTDLNWAQIPHPDRIGDVKRLVNIGSNYRNNLVVDDPFVSRYHAVLKIDRNNKAYLRDLGSRNGTIVNGVKITPNKDILIKKGDNVTLGNKDITDELLPMIPKKSSAGKIIGIIAAAAVFLGAIAIGAIFLLGKSVPGCGRGPVSPEIARQAVVYVTADYVLTAKLEDSPIAPEIWMGVINEIFPSEIIQNIEAGELPYEHVPYNATAFFVDHQGRMATNRHVAKPWDTRYLDADKQESLRSDVDRFVSDQQLPDAVYSIDDIIGFTQIAMMQPKFALWRMVYLQTEKRIKDGENDPVGYVNSLIRQLKKSKVTISGHLLEIKVGYPGRNYTHTDEFDRCSVLSVYPDENVDVALLQLNSKKTPADIEFVFSPDNFYLGELTPQKDKLTWIGYPRGSGWALDADTRSLEPTIRETTVAKVPSKYNFEFQGESLPGASGSPIYCAQNGGQLVGVLWGGNAGAATYGQAVLAKYVKKLYEEEVPATAN